MGSAGFRVSSGARSGSGPNQRRALQLSAPGSARPPVRTGPRKGGGRDTGAQCVEATILTRRMGKEV